MKSKEIKTLINDLKMMRDIDTEPIWNKLSEKIPLESSAANAEVRRVPVRRINRWYYAAAILVAVAAPAYLWLNRSEYQPKNQQAEIASVPQDILPPSNKAVLTLSDGSVIVLDNSARGSVGSQSGSTINISKDGSVSYIPTASLNAAPVSYNTMSTPRGVQTHLILPDQTQVWLNAASSITYPTAFPGKERKVIIKGEAYLEIANDKSKPFLVETNHGEITVLGTRFNVNSYDDENASTLTLLQGSVRFSSKTTNTDSAENKFRSVLLAPGQQAILANENDRPIDVIPHADINKVMAWKSGLFDFENMGLHEVMRELARWYDLDIQYEKGVPDIQFGGGMSRNVPLSDVLKGLGNMDIHFKIVSGRKLIVMP